MSRVPTTVPPVFGKGDQPVEVHMLGQFRVVKRGHVVALGESPKSQALLVSLAIRPRHTASREALLGALWPDRAKDLSCQSLNSLTSNLRRALQDAIGGLAPVVHDSGYYRINTEAGIGLDVVAFDELMRAGHLAKQSGRTDDGILSYERALAIYEGDLCSSNDLRCLMERERLRALHLTAIARIADYHFRLGDYAQALEYGHAMLAIDSCREDAHRLVMRCYVRVGERAQALHQFKLCEGQLAEQFDATPEAETLALFVAVRLDPTSI